MAQPSHRHIVAGVLEELLEPREIWRLPVSAYSYAWRLPSALTKKVDAFEIEVLCRPDGLHNLHWKAEEIIRGF